MRYHHERWDGAGYPDGLAGIQIPLLARAYAIADAFDALTGRRPYRTPLTTGAAVAQLYSEAGAAFDPDLFAAFLQFVSPASRGHV